MIFVTVGTQLPFDRLIRAIDEWAGANPQVGCFAQIGPGQYKPAHMEWSEFVPPSKANELFRQSELIVSHAGMGSILSALKFQRPILIMPRRADLGEHRNDHQLATAKWLGTRPGVHVAVDEVSLTQRLNLRNNLNAGAAVSELAQGPLVDGLKKYISAKS